MATACIQELNQKKCCVKNMDPYSSGLRSGKHAAPDAQTVAQNMAAHTWAAAAPAPPAPFATCPSLAPILWYTVQASQTSQAILPNAQHAPSATTAPSQVLALTHRWYPIPTTTAAAPSQVSVRSYPIPTFTAAAPSQVPASTHRSYPISTTTATAPSQVPALCHRSYPIPAAFPPTQTSYNATYPTYWPY